MPRDGTEGQNIEHPLSLVNLSFFFFVFVLYSRHLCQGVYSFRLSVRPFVRLYIRSFVCLFVRSYFLPVRGITSKFYVQAT